MKFDDQGHVLIKPKELQSLAFSDCDRLINHCLLVGTPAAFPSYSQYSRFVDYLAENTGIHPHHFLFRGSTKIGYSISPNRDKRKTWRAFGPKSDLDLAITDPHFFSTLDDEVRRHDRIPRNQERILRYKTGSEFRRYQERVDHKGRFDCYRYFNLPSYLDCLSTLKDVLNNAPIADCCSFEFINFEAFIFRDRWAVHQRYNMDLDDLRRGLTTKHNSLPQAPDSPFHCD